MVGDIAIIASSSRGPEKKDLELNLTEGIEKVIPGLLWLSINVVKLMSRPVKIQIGSRNRLRDTLNHQLVAGKLVITSLD